MAGLATMESEGRSQSKGHRPNLSPCLFHVNVNTWMVAWCECSWWSQLWLLTPRGKDIDGLSRKKKKKKHQHKCYTKLLKYHFVSRYNRREKESYWVTSEDTFGVICSFKYKIIHTQFQFYIFFFYLKAPLFNLNLTGCNLLFRVDVFLRKMCRCIVQNKFSCEHCFFFNWLTSREVQSCTSPLYVPSSGIFSFSLLLQRLPLLTWPQFAWRQLQLHLQPSRQAQHRHSLTHVHVHLHTHTLILIHTNTHSRSLSLSLSLSLIHRHLQTQTSTHIHKPTATVSTRFVSFSLLLAALLLLLPVLSVWVSVSLVHTCVCLCVCLSERVCNVTAQVGQIWCLVCFTYSNWLPDGSYCGNSVCSSSTICRMLLAVLATGQGYLSTHSIATDTCNERSWVQASLVN